MDPERPWATAVAIKNGMIVAVGDDATVRAECDATTEIVDGTGMHVVPGLTDSHFHPFWGSEATRGVDLTKVRTIEDLRAALAAERQRIGPDDWLVGWGLTFEMFSETGIRGDLFADAVGGGLALLGFFDGHTAVASPAALAFADVTGRERFEDFSTVVVDEHGVPTGELRENGAINLVRGEMPQPSAAQKYGWYVDNIRRWNALGLTGLHAMLGNPALFDTAREMEARGDLTIRMVIPLWYEPDASVDEMRSHLPLKDVKGRRWRGGVAKFFLDGVIESGTAWLVEPDTKGANDQPFWPDPEKYRAAVKLFAEAGFQCATHAVGDMAVRYALDSYELAGAATGVRHRVEHIELLTDEDLPRFAELGVVASMQPLHMAAFDAGGSDEWSTRVGPERRKRAFRTREIKDTGATLALGSDWMVAPYDPRIGMAWARLRRPGGERERGPIQPEQALTMLEVLEGYTTEAAYTVSEEQISGRIAEGFRGDLSAFAADLVEIDPDEIPELPVRLTVVDGQIVHRAE
ncbi:MAG: amidohydrolase [Thermomicrobiales bacterium]|nr:amidohydrolase [Thermomicrobiales bacterium]